VVLVDNELFPTWGGEGAAQPPVLRPRLVIRLSPQSAKDLADVLQNFVANYNKPMARRAPTTCCAKRAAATDAPFRSPAIGRISLSKPVCCIVITRR
jgi:hypothetical protein